MRRVVWGTVVVLALAAASVAAYGVFFTEFAIGTVYPAPATASLTCYPVDSGYQLVSANNLRADILATFVKHDAGKQTGICFLRPALANPDWNVLPPAPVTPPAPPAPKLSCPDYPTPPFPGAVCHPDGGWYPGLSQ
jgi:hypothetical protein